MRTRMKVLGVSCAALTVLVLSPLAPAEDTTHQPKPPAKTQAPAKAPGAQSKVPTLDDASRTALLKAIDNEREGIRFYDAVIAKHGSVRPFAQIVEAEKRHETELLNVAKRFALQVPDGAATKTPSVPGTVKDSCEAAAKWERDTTALLNQLSNDVKRPGIKNTLVRLGTLGKDRHLPAFERCVKIGGPLPEKAAAPPRCEGCGMVNCPCPHSAGAKAGSGAGKTPPACGCAGEKK